MNTQRRERSSEGIFLAGNKKKTIIRWFVGVGSLIFLTGRQIATTNNGPRPCGVLPLVETTTTSSSPPREQGPLSSALLPVVAAPLATLPQDDHRQLEEKLSKYAGSIAFGKRHVGYAAIWKDFGYTKGAEVGVWKGQFSKALMKLLKETNTPLEEYILVDPWRHLESWNKPWNVNATEFTSVYNEAMRNTQEFQQSGICKVIRGTQAQVAPKLSDQSLDWLYLDGDHTLRGIVYDLEFLLPKVRPGGMVCGDDFVDDDQVRGTDFAPTMVKPYVLLFGKAIGAKIVDMGGQQFCFIVP